MQIFCPISSRQIVKKMQKLKLLKVKGQRLKLVRSLNEDEREQILRSGRLMNLKRRLGKLFYVW